jgi:hypothetical protein
MLPNRAGWPVVARSLKSATYTSCRSAKSRHNARCCRLPCVASGASHSGMAAAYCCVVQGHVPRLATVGRFLFVHFVMASQGQGRVEAKVSAY